MNNLPNRSSRSALRTLLIVLVIAASVVIYAYGWTTTDISLEEVRDETRQSAVIRALRELFSPDLFVRDRESSTHSFEFQVGCPDDPDAIIERDRELTGEDAYVVLDPPCADVNENITIEGFNFPANALAGLRIPVSEDQSLPFKVVEDGVSTEATEFDVANDGYFKVTLTVPRGRGLSGDTVTVNVHTISPTGWPRLSETTKTVIDKMVETIFLALMATTLALPIAVALSFTAARNLMRQVRMPLGNVLVGMVLLPVGAVVGQMLVGPIGSSGVDWGKDLWPGLVAMAAGIGIFAVVARLVAAWNPPNVTAQRLSGLLVNVLLLAVIILVFGVLGGIFLWLAEPLDSGLLEYLGNFLDTIGQLIELSIGFFAALGGAALFASLGATWSAVILRRIYSPLSNVLGGILGFLSGAIVLAATAYLGTQAVLLGLVSAIIVAILAGNLLVLIYQRFFMMENGHWKARHEETNTETTFSTMLFAVGAVAGFLLAAYYLDLLRSVVDGRLPSERMIGVLGYDIQVYIAKSALLGGILGGLSGAVAGTDRTFPLGMTVYNTSRTILNALRSIEPLIMGIVFVIWVGVGPFAGVLALTLHSIAALGKLYSEQVENIDAGPIEAIQSTGANRLQTIVYAVVPQIVPPYIAFTMYRWDINVRMSTIIGFVGGGGIGFLLQQQINLLRYKQAGVAVLAIAIVVSVLDYASAAIRERIV